MSLVYNGGKYELLRTGLYGRVVKAILVTQAYKDVANEDDLYISQLNATNNPALGAVEEITASAGYVRGFSGSGRIVVDGFTFSIDPPTNQARFNCNDLLWTLMTQTVGIYGLVFAEERTADTDSPLLAFFDGTPLPVASIVAQDFELTMPTDGVIIAA